MPEAGFDPPGEETKTCVNIVLHLPPKPPPLDDDFDHEMECVAPFCWSKYTTLKSLNQGIHNNSKSCYQMKAWNKSNGGHLAFANRLNPVFLFCDKLLDHSLYPYKIIEIELKC